MSLSAAALAEGERLRDYSDKFLVALRPIIIETTGSALEIELARGYLRTQSKHTVYTTYHKQMDKVLNGRPIWWWVATCNEQLLMNNPEMLIGNNNDKVKAVITRWVSVLSAKQKVTVWQWAHSMLMVAGYDIAQAAEEHSQGT
jgi:hypothetical protein